jgi:transposase-like protein
VKLWEADASQSTGVSVEQICKQLEISQATYHKWRNQYGGMKADEMKRLKELERENARLKKIVADLSIDNSILKEVAKGNF